MLEEEEEELEEVPLGLQGLQSPPGTYVELPLSCLLTLLKSYLVGSEYRLPLPEVPCKTLVLLWSQVLSTMWEPHNFWSSLSCLQHQGTWQPSASGHEPPFRDWMCG